ncbi:MAG TPA: helix-turn-helix transcriptional regulator [Thermoanaerobaculia bacterium]|nr:helix-turn-helix transcriptional regulator [Thermoanaerobaculia bacterium]
MPRLENIGERLRTARRNRQMSLESVAKKLGVSVATLSRIETNKQGIDLPFFVELAHVIGIEPSAFVGENGGGNGSDGLVRQLAALPPDQRMLIMAETARDSRPSVKRGDLHRRLDGLLTTLDLIRDELLAVRSAVKDRG